MDHTPALTETQAAEEAARLISEAYQPATSYRDPSPIPTTGTTPPVAQPGRPPMSQRATDISGVMLAGSVASVSVGGATSLVLYTLGQVDPTALAIGAAGPLALVLAVGSLIRSIGRAKQDAHTEHHHHYNGPVRQETTTISSTTAGLLARTRNHAD